MMGWRSVIEKTVTPLHKKMVPLQDALGQIAAAPLYARLPSPAHAESLRDGYLCYQDELNQAMEVGLPIVFEAAAGTLDVPPLKRGTTQRIFTGALVRGEVDRLCVVLQESCRKEGDRVFLKESYPPKAPSFIAEAGSIFAAGVELAVVGTMLDGWKIARLAAGGIREVPVFSAPSVFFCSSGSELVAPDSGRDLLPGEKYSVNDLLVKDGIAPYGGCLHRFWIPDSHEELVDFFCNNSACCDLLITSGGMGPGKYDLVRSAFLAAGGKIELDSFAMLPGKGAMFGLLGKTPVLCLPGPPHAMAPLVYELIIPVVRLLRGEKQVWPETLAATLMEDGPDSASFLRIKPGMLLWRQQQWFVTTAGDGQSGNCHIFYPAGKKVCKGDLITVHRKGFSFI